jgi:hypothetical protein
MDKRRLCDRRHTRYADRRPASTVARKLRSVHEPASSTANELVPLSDAIAAYLGLETTHATNNIHPHHGRFWSVHPHRPSSHCPHPDGDTQAAGFLNVGRRNGTMPGCAFGPGQVDVDVLDEAAAELRGCRHRVRLVKFAKCRGEMLRVVAVDAVRLPRERKAHVPPPLAEHVERVAETLATTCCRS